MSVSTRMCVCVCVCVCVKKETGGPISTLPVVLSALGAQQVPGPSQ